MSAIETCRYASTDLIILSTRHRANGARFGESKRDTSTGPEYEFGVITMAAHWGFQIVRYAPYAKNTSAVGLTREQTQLVNRTAFLNLTDEERLQPLVVTEYPFYNDYTENNGKSEFAIFNDGICEKRLESKCLNGSGSVIEKLEAHSRRIQANTYPEPILIYVFGGKYFNDVRIAHHNRKLKEAGLVHGKTIEVVSFHDFCSEWMKDILFSVAK